MVRQSRSIQGARAFLKCAQCRKDNKKCDPSERDWNGAQQKCDRCHRLGHDCGPSVRKPKLLTAATNKVTENVSPFQDLNQREELLGSGALGAITSLPTPTEPEPSHRTATDIGRLAAMVSTHEILLLCLFMFIRTAEGLNLEPTKVARIRSALGSLIEQIYAAFERAEKIEEKRSLSMKDPEREVLCLKMAYLRERRYHLLNMKSLPDANVGLVERDRGFVNFLPDNVEGHILSCTSKIFAKQHVESYTPLNRVLSKMDDYINLESYITEILSKFHNVDLGLLAGTTELDASTQPASSTFPASHIAYWNNDRDIALQLWKRSSDHHYDTDILGRTLLHVTAAAKDKQTIQDIVRHDAGVAWHTCRDRLGLRPLDYLSGPDDHACRQLLYDHGMRPALSQNLFCMPSREQLAQRLQAENLPNAATIVGGAQQGNHTSAATLTDLENLDFEDLDFEQFFLQNSQFADVSGPVIINDYSALDGTFDHGLGATYPQHVFATAPESSEQTEHASSYASSTMSGLRFSSYPYNHSHSQSWPGG